MKKILLAGILALILIGGVMAAGCTSVSTTESGKLNPASGTVSQPVVLHPQYTESTSDI